MPEALALQKTSMRAEVRARLKNLGPARRLEDSLRITGHILEFPAWQRAQTCCLFASLPSEPETRTLMTHAWNSGKRVALPRIQHPEEGLSLHWTDSFHDLKRGPRGFEEPGADTETARLADLDLILVPGIAFDRQGGRLGRGGGYYDRLLPRPECRAVVLGIFFSVQEVPRVPRETWDHPLQWIVTEAECFRVLPGNSPK